MSVNEDFSKLRGLSLKAVTSETSLLVVHLEDDSLIGIVTHCTDGKRYNGLRMAHEYDKGDPELPTKIEDL